jgi:hypothetical protein
LTTRGERRARGPTGFTLMMRGAREATRHEQGLDPIQIPFVFPAPETSQE